MGKSRFKLSHLVPSSWFYKLPKNNTATSDHHQEGSSHIIGQVHDDRPQYYHEDHSYVPISTRSSCYISGKERLEKLSLSPLNRKLSDIHFPKDSPRKSVRVSTSTTPAKLLVSSSSSSSTPPPSCSTPPSKSVNGHCIDHDQFKDLEIISEFKLPPILTKPVKKDQVVIHQRPKEVARGRRLHKMLLADSLVVVKPSVDPQRDFRESMAEMIVENGIRSPEDLEELLACYLSLNSREYHGTILKVFKQIWFELKLYMAVIN